MQNNYDWPSTISMMATVATARSWRADIEEQSANAFLCGFPLEHVIFRRTHRCQSEWMFQGRCQDWKGKAAGLAMGLRPDSTENGSN